MPRHRPPRGQNPRGGKREGAGRPRGPTAFKHLRDLAQSGTEEAIGTIADMMNDESNPARLRLAAAKASSSGVGANRARVRWSSRKIS